MNSDNAKASARPLFLLGNTYITSGASLKLQNYSVPPWWLLQRHQFGDWKEMNATEAVKSRKQRRTLKQMFLDLKELGYKGSYDRVAAFGRRWKVGQMERVNSASKSTA